jgi:hypothetical protein
MGHDNRPAKFPIGPLHKAVECELLLSDDSALDLEITLSLQLDNIIAETSCFGLYKVIFRDQYHNDVTDYLTNI